MFHTQQQLTLTTKCPSLLEFYTFYGNVESFRGDVGSFTFSAAVPTLTKCNEVEDYSLEEISFTDLDGNPLPGEGSLAFSLTCE